MDSLSVSKSSTWLAPSLTAALLAAALYLNTLNAEFVYDDSRAIVNNYDLRPTTSWRALFQNDFWGTPLRHSGSHKSYRPLTVATYRLNYAIGELNPFGYHLVNVLLHSVVSALVARLAHRLSEGDSLISWSAGLLFAAHPIHTEAVAGVVGRADLLSTVCYLISFLCYERTVNNDQRRQLWWLLLCILSAIGAVLTKEHGFSVLGVCLVYDLALASVSSFDWKSTRYGHVSEQDSGSGRTSISRWLATRCSNIRYRAANGAAVRWQILVIVGAAVLYVRLWLMDFSAPYFSPSDNPAAHSDNCLIRTATFAYLFAFNMFLMVCPSTLSFDWSMNAIPLITAVGDIRNIVSLAVLSSLTLLGVCLLCWLSVSRMSDESSESIGGKCALDINGNPCYERGSQPGRQSPEIQCRSCNNNNNRTGYRSKFRSKSLNLFDRSEADTDTAPIIRTSFVGLSILLLSYLPASNLIAYVGFVVAERILYLPSVGYCLLIACGLRTGCRSVSPKMLKCLCLLFLAVMCAKTVRRNGDWRSEEFLYSSGIRINPAKSYGNLGNVYAQQRRFAEASEAYRRAITERPNMADAHYNYGVLLQEHQRWNDASHAYESAIQFRPTLALAHLNLGIVLMALGRREDAEKRYQHCASLSCENVKDPNAQANAKISCLYNLGRLLTEDGRFDEAVATFQSAIGQLTPSYQAHSLYNVLGDALMKSNRLNEAELAFTRSLAIKQDHIPAHLTYAGLLTKQGKSDAAFEYLTRAAKLAPTDSTVWQHLGQYYIGKDDYQQARLMYEKAFKLDGEDFNAMFALASVYRHLRENMLAEELYRKVVAIKPESSSAHMNLGAMLHLNKKYADAEHEYRQALRLNPNDDMTRENLRKLQNLKLKVLN